MEIRSGSCRSSSARNWLTSAVRETVPASGVGTRVFESVTSNGSGGASGALTASFGAMNTMYAQVAARTREIGTLRAIGFSRRAVLGAFIFAADFSTPAGYQVALAQHLAKSNATFYGAFW